ncbi:hypothetical protein ACFLUV_06515 [Elusimicrobiota bacterium]
MKSDIKKIIINSVYVVFVLWAIAIMAVFFIKTVNIPVIQIGKSICGWLIAVVAAMGTGNKIRKLIGINTVTFLEDISVDMALGLGIVQFVVLIMGALGMYRPVFAWLVLGFLILLSINNLYEWIKDLSRKWQQHSENRFSFIGALFLIVLAVGLFIAFLSSVTPPVDDYALTGAPALAKQYVVRGGLHAIPHNYSSNFPPAMSMLYVLGLLLSGNYIMGLFSFSFFLLLSIAIYSMTRKFFHRKIALFAATIIITTPIVFKMFIVSHPFMGGLFYSFMSFYSYICWTGMVKRSYKSSEGWLVLAGLFAAFSLCWGFYALFTPMVLLILIFYRTIKIDEINTPRKIAEKMLYFIVPFIAGILPVWMKNIFNTGNPFFPFFMTNAGKDAALSIEGIKSLWGYLLPLWYIPFEKNISFLNFYYTGPVYVIFLPAVFLIKEVGKTIKALMTFAGVYILIYLFAGRKIMFLYSIIPVLSIITAYILVNLYGQKKYFYQYVMSVFLIAVGVNFYTVWPWLNIQDKVSLVLGYMDKDVYLVKNISGYEAMDYINKHTSRDAKVLLVGEKRTLYLNKEVVYQGQWSKIPFIESVNRAGSIEALLEDLKSQEITHILVDKEEVEKLHKYHNNYWNDYIDSVFEELVKNRLNLKYSDERYFVYEI